MNTQTENSNNYSRIHTYWSHLNKVELDRSTSIRSPREINPNYKSTIDPVNNNYRISNKDLKFDSGKNLASLNIALCTICNDDFIDGARVMLYSFLRHNSWFKGKVIVYYNRAFSPLSGENMNLLRHIYDNIEFKLVDQSAYSDLIAIFIKGNKQQRRLVPSLFTFEVFSDIKYYDKLLYLDSDMVVMSDISEVFSLKHELVVTPDAGEYIHRNYDTFNGGFLFLDNSISSKGYKEKLIKHAEGMKSMQLADQTIMNSFFWEGLPMLGIDYNCLKRCFSDSKFSNDIKNVKIIHYVGEKPWKEKVNQMEKNYSKVEEIWHNELKKIESNAPIKLGIFIHIYYIDLWKEISDEIKKINIPFDLHVSLCKDNKDISDSILKEYPNACIVKVKNAGADFGGFFESLNNSFDLNLKYDWILKIHGKKSKLINERAGESWRKNLYKSLIEEFKIKILNHLNNPEAGMIGPKNQIMSMSSFDRRAGKNVNKQNIDLLRKKFNIKDDQLKFFKGSMFWIKYSILENIFKNNRITIDFFEDGHSQDGTKAHAMERFMSNIVRDSGKKIIET